MTATNGEGAFVQVDRTLIGWDETLNFVSSTGEIVSWGGSENREVWAIPAANGFVLTRYNSGASATDETLTRVWYDSSGGQTSSPVVMHSPLFEIALAMRPDGQELASLVPTEEPSEGLALRLFDSAGSLEPPGSIPLPDSAGLLGEVMVVFDAMGDVLVARREVQRGQECLNGDFTPERWAWWWIGQDHRASARLDLFGSRLGDAQVKPTSLLSLLDGRIAVAVQDRTCMEDAEWSWTVSRTAGVRPAPCWLAKRPASSVQWIRSGRGYLVTERYGYGSRMEILASTGEVCGTLRDVCPACETAWTVPVSVGLDGTVSYRADPNFELDAGTCGIDWQPGALR